MSDVIRRMAAFGLAFLHSSERMNARMEAARRGSMYARESQYLAMTKDTGGYWVMQRVDRRKRPVMRWCHL